MNREYRIGVGASSLLMVFAVLCLTTLGVLALSSARADLALTERSVERAEAYYRAAALAQERIAEIAGQAGEYEVSEFPGARAEGEDIYVDFAVPVDERSRIEVTLQIGGPDGRACKVVRHELVNTGEWLPDDTLELYYPAEEPWN